jgi:arylsulfatase A-like enzyme
MNDFQSTRKKNGKIAIGMLLVLIPMANQGNDTKPTDKKNSPNIIFIMSDDHAYQAISAYNKELIKTPGIDRIANEGAIMNSAYVNNSLCGPSRAAILTGKYSHINGFKDNHDLFDGDQQTLPKILKSNGYHTAIVGKWHLVSTPQGFDYWNILPGQGEYYNPRFINMGKDTVYNGYVTDITTDLALNWLDSNKDKPFFLMIHQKAPHRNQMPPLKYLDLFNDREFTYPPTFFDDYKDKLALQRNGIRMADNLDIDQDSKIYCDTCKLSQTNKWNPKAYQRELGRLTPSQRKIWDAAYQKENQEYESLTTKEELIQWQFQRYMEDYLRCIKSVDDNVGRVLQYLEDNGLDKNTIVVYTSDQGVFLGEHGLYDKRFMYNESFRTPMMIRYPKEIKAGQQLNDFVMNLDIAPTFLDYAGISIPTDMQGVSMRSILADTKVPDWRDKVYYHYYEKSYGLTAHYGILTKRYKLIHFYDPIDVWELYDLQNDPNEMHNIYQNPENSSLIASLKAQLKELQIKYNDEQKF